MELLQEFLSILNIFLGNIYVIKDDLDHFEKICKTCTVCLVSQIWIRYNYYGSGSQRTRTHKHWYWP
jgi:hypothetical protein